MTFSQRRLIALATICLAGGSTIAAANAGAIRSSIRTIGNAVTKCDSPKNCVEWLNSGAGAGVVGVGTAGPGLVGETKTTVAKTPAIQGFATGTVGRGVEGDSSSAEGVFGEADSYFGVRGVTDNTRAKISDAGVEGLDGATDLTSTNAGVLGVTTNSGAGVVGNSKTTSAQSTAAGVEGFSHLTEASDPAQNPALAGVSLAGEGLYAFSASGGGAYFENNVSSIGTLDIHADASNGFPLVSKNEVTGDHVDFDSQGDVLASGVFQGGGPAETTHRTKDGRHVLAYGTEAAEATLEDVGTAQLVGGRGVVVIEPRFASTIDGGSYHVFLTPLGDTRGLYVSLKSPSEFIVRETQGGRASLAFDYRIVARPADSHGTRLPAATNQLAGLVVHAPTAREAMAKLKRADAMDH